MPATLVAPHVAPVKDAAESASVADLSYWERQAALYASDMPDRASSRTVEPHEMYAWVLQGAARLGWDGCIRRGAHLSGYRFLWMNRALTTAQQTAHRALFPSERRLHAAESLHADLSFRSPIRPSKAAESRRRISNAVGPCTCQGKGWLQIDIGVTQECAGHTPSDLPMSLWTVGR
jgi:hypothetical protein